MFAMSFHSFFEGIAVGIIENMGSLINLVIGISIHQFVMSVSLGSSLKNK